MEDYRQYADLLFERFDDRVKHWMTFNEPSAYVGFAHDDGVFAPGRCSSWMKNLKSQLLRESYDFIELQYYTAYYAKPNITVDPNYHRYKTSSGVIETSYDNNGNLIGPKISIQHFLIYSQDTYNDLVIYITENGVDNFNNETQPIEKHFKIDYYRKYLWNALGSLKEYNVNIKGYFALSYLDNFEWNIGYTSGFSLYNVDCKDNLKRYLKKSALWFTTFLNIG
ncbi:beta-glucosidase 11-like [Manihot esculenta]|uniref:beta-glucosidase 11-like n=1 Tax=Manihot esculenta TaxID=3983 RepID=UPI001CC70E30|nr:beta-glucosidase 11-like [Manihot esculenta]